jgi:hypothetical protein
MEWWLNELDVEWRLPLYLLSRQLRTGASFGRSELFGGSRTRSGPTTCTRPVAGS